MELQRPQGAWSSSSLGADAILGADAWLNAYRVSRSLLWRPQGPEEGPGKAAPLGGSGGGWLLPSTGAYSLSAQSLTPSLYAAFL